MDDLLSETVSLSESEIIAANPPEPKSIGSGIVKSILGKGGASVVYEIWNPKLEIFRAVKLWRPVQSEKTIQRFENEIKITAKLHHPNIVDIYTVGEWNGLPYIEMEKIQGINLKEMIKTRGAVPELVAAAIVVCICRALSYAHQHEYILSGKSCKGVIHCDIKPANIMISESGIVKLMDFGIAHPSNIPNPSEKSSITGSLQYMSPEQLNSRPLDNRSDLYSLGVLLYELLSGTKAFPASTIKELIQKRKKNDYFPLGYFCKNLSVKARAIVEKLMQVDPDERFQSADELMVEIEKNYPELTEEAPDALISSFLAGEKIKEKIKIKFPKLSHVSLLFLIFILSFFIFSVFLWNNKRHTGFNFIQAVSPVPADSLNKIPHPQENTPAKTVVNNNKRSTIASKTPTPASVKTKTSSYQKNTVQPRSKPAITSQPSVKNIESVLNSSSNAIEEVNDATILDEINRLVNEGQLSQAERMLQEFPIRDAEYHLIYAELHLKKQRTKAAMQEAEKALRVAAARISPSELREKVLYYKAKVLSVEYENAPDKLTGQKAMEAWYEVKYALRSNTAHPHYIKADAEIRRISVSLQ
jgi:serine/threonine protein kinase